MFERNFTVDLLLELCSYKFSIPYTIHSRLSHLSRKLQLRCVLANSHKSSKLCSLDSSFHALSNEWLHKASQGAIQPQTPAFSVKERKNAEYVKKTFKVSYKLMCATLNVQATKVDLRAIFLNLALIKYSFMANRQFA